MEQNQIIGTVMLAIPASMVLLGAISKFLKESSDIRDFFALIVTIIGVCGIVYYFYFAIQLIRC